MTVSHGIIWYRLNAGLVNDIFMIDYVLVGCRLSDSQQGVGFQHKNEWTFSYDLSQKTFASLECKRTIKEGFWIRLTLYRIFASQTPACRLVATHVVFISIMMFKILNTIQIST